MNYRTAVLKRNLELAGMFPFVLLGKIAGKLFPLKTKHNIFLFFPNPDIGGAVKVNADITNCIGDLKPLIIFSKKPKNGRFREMFDVEGVRVMDIHKYIDNKLFHFVNFFFRGVIASWIDAAENPVIFAGESIFFYKIVPHVKKRTLRVELCHVNTWFNFSQAFAKYIDARIFSTPKIKRDLLQQYTENGVPEMYRERVHFIDNKTDIPDYIPANNETLQVLFVGRNSPQKRVPLVAAIARQMHEAGANAHFSFVGDVDDAIPDEVKQYCTLYGQVADKDKLDACYRQADVLILTSAFEGLPIVVMDMMARGRIVLSTAVDGIPDYITHMENGLLITEREEEKIVAQGVALLQMLIADPLLKKEIGIAAYRFACSRFGGAQFCKTYRDIFSREQASCLF